MSKSLAVVGRIIETCPIEGADFIQQCRVDCGTAGIWTGVAGKALAAYVDSVRSSDIRQSGYGEGGTFHPCDVERQRRSEK